MNSIKFRIFKNFLFKYFLIFISFITIIPLFLIIFYILKKGIMVINWNFLFSLPKPMGEEGGGILNSLTGTCILIILAVIFSVPIGIFAGIYVAENQKSRISGIIRWCLEVMQGIPSIVIGLIGYTWIVLPFKKFSALSGGFALGLMMLPVVIKATEETIKLIPHSLKEASLALGVPYHRTILKVILPSSLSGIVTGILLGVARISGETAPLLFTAFGNPSFSTNIFKPIDSLPLMIFTYSTSPYEEWHRIAWGASFILVMFIFILNIITRLVVKRWKIQF